MMFCNENGNDTHIVSVPQTTIKSPNFPNNYPSGVDCTILVKFPAEQRVHLVFKRFDVFQDEQDKENERCTHSDWVEIWDANRLISSERSKIFCGNKIPRPVLSTGNMLMIKFHSSNKSPSDKYGTGKYFMMIA